MAFLLIIFYLCKAFSYYYHGVLFWIFFCIVYLIFIITVGVNIYNLGVIRYDAKILFNVTKLLVWEVRKTLSNKTEESTVPLIRIRWTLH